MSAHGRPMRSPPPSSSPTSLSGSANSGYSGSFSWDKPNRIIAAEVVSEPELGKTFLCAHALADKDDQGKITKCHSAIGDTEHKAWIEADKIGNTYIKLIDDMQDFRDFVDHCLKDPDIKVVCIDSGSDIRQFAEDEFLRENPDLKRIYPVVLYGRVFAKIDSQVMKLNKGGKHVVFTGRIRDEFEDDVRTGRKVRDSYKKLPYQLPVIIMLQRGIRDPKTGRMWFSNHVFGEVVKNSFYKRFKEKFDDKLSKPWLFDASFEGMQNELVINSWDEKNIIWSAHEWLHANNITHDEKGTELLKEDA